MTQIVDNYFGGAKDFVAASVTAVKGLKYDMVGLRGVVAHGIGTAEPFRAARHQYRRPQARTRLRSCGSKLKALWTKTVGTGRYRA